MNANDGFECRGLWWLPGAEESAVSGVLRVADSGALSLALVGSLGGKTSMFADKTLPIILGSVDKGPKGNDITLTETFLTGTIHGTFKSVREAYHVGRAYFGAHLPNEAAFHFSAMRMRLGGLKQWARPLSGLVGNTSPFPPPGESGPLVLYRPHHPVKAELPGATATLGFGLSAKFALAEAKLREEAQFNISLVEPASADEFIVRYGYPMRCLMSFVSDRAQAIDEFTVWRPNFPDQEIVVMARLIQPPLASDEDVGDVGSHEMLFTLAEVDFAAFLPRWLELFHRHEDACNAYFGLMYGPPAYLDLKYQEVAGAVRLYFERSPDGETCRLQESQHLAEVQSYIPEPQRRWLYDHLGQFPRPTLRFALDSLMDKHGKSIEQLIGSARQDFVDLAVETWDFVTRRDREFAVSAAFGADLYWLNEKLRFLLKACFLSELGFSPEEVHTCFRRSSLFHHIHQQESQKRSKSDGKAEEEGDLHAAAGTRPRAGD